MITMTQSPGDVVEGPLAFDAVTDTRYGSHNGATGTGPMTWKFAAVVPEA
jgi:hypothetical protein